MREQLGDGSLRGKVALVAGPPAEQDVRSPLSFAEPEPLCTPRGAAVA